MMWVVNNSFLIFIFLTVLRSQTFAHHEIHSHKCNTNSRCTPSIAALVLCSSSCSQILPSATTTTTNGNWHTTQTCWTFNKRWKQTTNGRAGLMVCVIHLYRYMPDIASIDTTNISMNSMMSRRKYLGTWRRTENKCGDAWCATWICYICENEFHGVQMSETAKLFGK